MNIFSDRSKGYHGMINEPWHSKNVQQSRQYKTLVKKMAMANDPDFIRVRNKFEEYNNICKTNRLLIFVYRRDVAHSFLPTKFFSGEKFYESKRSIYKLI